MSIVYYSYSTLLYSTQSLYTSFNFENRSPLETSFSGKAWCDPALYAYPYAIQPLLVSRLRPARSNQQNTTQCTMLIVKHPSPTHSPVTQNREIKNQESIVESQSCAHLYPALLALQYSILTVEADRSAEPIETHSIPLIEKRTCQRPKAPSISPWPRFQAVPWFLGPKLLPWLSVLVFPCRASAAL
ncbi:unnamed protein product [Penicillium manginii]